MQLTDDEKMHLIRLLSKWTTNAVVFGSRATGKAKPFSDVDICLVGGVPRSEVTLLREACDNSTFPYVVDLSRFEDLTESFQDAVKREGIPLRPAVS